MLETFIRNAAQTYEHEQFGKIRVIEKEGNPWFIAKDICAALGLAQVSRAIQKLDEDEVTSSKVIDSLGREQTANAISESRMYSLVLVSRKPEAKAFKRWVTHEVLPSIRKHGGYLTPEKAAEALTDPDTIIRLATNLKEERAKRQELEAENRELAPKAVFADAVAASDDTMLVGDLRHGQSPDAMADRLNGALAGVPRILGKLVERIGVIKPKLAALAERHLLRFGVAHPEQLALEILASLNGFGIASVEGHRPLGVLPRCWVDANAYLYLPFAASALRLVLHRIYAAYALRPHG